MNKKPKWYVTKVIPKEDYTLLLTFADGKKGIYDFKPNLHYPVYQKQKDIASSCRRKQLIHLWFGPMTVILIRNTYIINVLFLSKNNRKGVQIDGRNRRLRHKCRGPSSKPKTSANNRINFYTGNVVIPSIFSCRIRNDN